MTRKEGKLSVSTENIFPIIRQWLYSDRDIFIRELVSNATDAISKMERLVSLGDAKLADDPTYRIDVVLDSEAGTLAIIDNGLGMTAAEIDKYINDIAYSGAVDFVQHCEEAGGDAEGIIGHFGLGFYSAFMVADKVEINSLSWQQGAEPARWVSETGTEYAMDKGDCQERGTTITLTLDEDAQKELTADHLRSILHKYCEFMPQPIFFKDVVGDRERQAAGEKRYQADLEAYRQRKSEAEAENKDFTEHEPIPPTPVVEQPVNDTDPLWKKNPRQVDDQAYIDFYHKACRDYKDPLFWIHLNMDYPFRLQGILYFPELENRYETLDGRIKLYNNQVFVADNLQDIIPDFLFLLKGFIDSPDVPLNVSRSALQADSHVKKLSDHIVRKVADKLNELFKKERETYAGYWKDIHIFIKYGVLRDEKFYDRVKESLLFIDTEGKDHTLAELGQTVHYTVDQDQQVSYIRRAQKAGHTVVVLDDELDIPFISYLESKQEGLKFARIDTDLEGEAGKEEWQETVTDLFRQAAADEKLAVEVKALGADEPAAALVETEASRRNLEMRKQFERMQGKQGDFDLAEAFPVERKLEVNTDAALTDKLVSLVKAGDEGKLAAEVAEVVYDLARLSHGSLQGDDLNRFLKRNTAVLNALLSTEQ